MQYDKNRTKPLHSHTGQSGFTLLELSIVIVIIGLIASGVVVGRHLIEAAKIRQVSSEMQQFQAAINTFRIQYNCKPGDCNNATTFFPTMTCTNSPCNGNGSKIIGWRDSGGYGPEWMYLWLHLGESGLIEGRYSGEWTAGPTVGEDIPKSKYREGIGWYLEQNPSPSGYFAHFNPGAHYMRMASQEGGGGHYFGWNSVRASEAKQIDQKLDDGLPLSGKIIDIDYYSPCVNSTHTDYNILGEALGGDESLTNCSPNFRLDW